MSCSPGVTSGNALPPNRLRDSLSKIGRTFSSISRTEAKLGGRDHPVDVGGHPEIGGARVLVAREQSLADSGEGGKRRCGQRPGRRQGRAGLDGRRPRSGGVGATRQTRERDASPHAEQGVLAELAARRAKHASGGWAGLQNEVKATASNGKGGQACHGAGAAGGRTDREAPAE